MTSVFFLGQKWVGQSCFDKLLAYDKAIDIVGCATNASKSVWWKENRIWKQASERGVQCVDNSRRNNDEIADIIDKNGAEVILSVQHPWIIPAGILQQVNGRAFNIHNAPLPSYKGHNACNHAILNSEQRFCSTLHWMTAGADEGDVIKEQWFAVDSQDTARSLYDKGIRAAETLFEHLLDLLVSGEEIASYQAEGTPHFYPRDSIDDLRHVPSDADPETVDRYSRAFYFPPFEPAYQMDAGHKRYLIPDGHNSYAGNL